MYPHERSLVKALESQPFVLLGVNSDDINSDDDLSKLKQVIEDEEITWRSWQNSAGSQPISEQFGVRGWPTLFLIDAQGVIRAKWEGSPGDALEPAIQQLIQEL